MYGKMEHERHRAEDMLIDRFRIKDLIVMFVRVLIVHLGNL